MSRLSLLSVIASLDDVSEALLKGGTTDQEAVDIGLRDKVCSILLGDGAAIEDAGLLRNVSADVGLQPGAELVVDLLSLLWGSGLACSDGPYWLVGDNNV